MTKQGQFIQHKIRQLVYLLDYYGENQSANMTDEYNRIYSEWQSGVYTLDKIQEDIDSYM